MSNKFYYQLAALFHDSGREGDGDDLDSWEQDSAVNLYAYLTECLKVSDEKAIHYAECILNKDYQPRKGSTHYWRMRSENKLISFGKEILYNQKLLGCKLLHDADCLDVIRARKNFDFQYLDIYEYFTFHKKYFEAHVLIQTLIQEVTRLITVTGNDRYVKNDAYESFEKNFYSDPSRSFENLLNFIVNSIDNPCPTNIKFKLLSLFHKNPQGELHQSCLKSYLEDEARLLANSMTIEQAYQSGMLWSSPIKLNENYYYAKDLTEKIRIIPGGYYPEEIGYLLGPASDPRGEIENYYCRLPSKTPEHDKRIENIDRLNIQGFFYIEDFNRRSQVWIKAKKPAFIPEKCFTGYYKLSCYILKAKHKESTGKELDIYGINLSTSTIEKKNDVVCNKTIIAEIKSNIDMLTSFVSHIKFKENNYSKIMYDKLFSYTMEECVNEIYAFFRQLKILSKLAGVKNYLYYSLNKEVKINVDSISVVRINSIEIFDHKKILHQASHHTTKEADLRLNVSTKLFFKKDVTASNIKNEYTRFIEHWLYQSYSDTNSFFKEIEGKSRGITFLRKIKNDVEEIRFYQIWHHSDGNDVASRIICFLVFQDKQDTAYCYYKIFGNIDIIVLPFKKKNLNIEWVTNDNRNRKIFDILPENIFHIITQFLDHGQSLNLAQLISLLGYDKFKRVFYSHKNAKLVTHNDNVYDFIDHAENARNGKAMMYLPSNNIYSHLTRHSDKIIKNGKISLSKGGCLGSVIYSTQVLNNRYIAGLTHGLWERLFENKPINEDNMLLFIQSPKMENSITDWINSYGFGRLKLEAILSVVNVNKTLFKDIEIVCEITIQIYAVLHELFAFLHDYSNRLKQRETWDVSEQQKHSLKNIINLEFEYFWNIFDKCRNFVLQDKAFNGGCWLNNLLFETLKDYIMLYQETANQDILTRFGSFDMSNQYHFFFSLDPSLKYQGFCTESFKPLFDNIIHQLASHGIPHLKDDQLELKKFILDRFSATINVYMLDGAKSFIHPYFFVSDKTLEYSSRSKFIEFLRFSQYHPNLFGNLLHSIIKPEKSRWQKLYDTYEHRLHHLYTLSYDERDIHIPIKANICATDEIGMRKLSNITIHLPVRLQEEQGLHAIKEISNNLPVIIDGVTQYAQLRIYNEGVKEMDLLIAISNKLTSDFFQNITHDDLILIENYISRGDDEILTKSGVVNKFSCIFPELSFRDAFKVFCLYFELDALFKINSYERARKKIISIDTLLLLVSSMMTMLNVFNKTFVSKFIYFISMYYFKTIEGRINCNEMLIKFLPLMIENQSLIEARNFSRSIANLANQGLIINVTKDSFLGSKINGGSVSFIALVVLDLDGKKIQEEFFQIIIDYFFESQDKKSLVIFDAIAKLSFIQASYQYFNNHDIYKILEFAPHEENALFYEFALEALNNLICSYSFDKKNFSANELFQSLLRLLNKNPEFSLKIFSIINAIISLLNKNFVENLLESIYEAIRGGQSSALDGLPSFFSNIQNYPEFLNDLKKIPENFRKFLLESDITISHLQFVSCAYRYIDFEQDFIHAVMRSILNEKKVINFSGLSILARFLVSFDNRQFFLSSGGLNRILKEAILIQEHYGKKGQGQAHASLINNILKKYFDDNVQDESFLGNMYVYFCHLLLQENEDYLSVPMAYLLKNNELNKLFSGYDDPINVDALSNFSAFLIGLSEVPITDDISNNIMNSIDAKRFIEKLLDKRFIENSGIVSHEIVLKCILNIFSRKQLRECFSVSLNNLFRNIDRKTLSIEEDLSLDLEVLYKSIRNETDSLEINEILDKEIVVAKYINDIKSYDHDISFGAANCLELLAKNIHFTRFISTPLSISRLKARLLSAEHRLKSVIIDVFFWLIVNDDAVAQELDYCGVVPIIIGLLGDSSDEVVRAALGLLVNLDFAYGQLSLERHLNMIVNFVFHRNEKIVKNALELLNNLELTRKKLVSIIKQDKNMSIIDLNKRLSFLFKNENQDIADAALSLWNKISRKYYEIFSNLKCLIGFSNKFALHFLTYHPLIPYKEKKYFSELLANTPAEFSKSCITSGYIYTQYLSEEQAEKYRVLINEYGLLVSAASPFQLINFPDVALVCMTLDGKIYTAVKSDSLQHTSFNKGKYLIFAGYWHVKSGQISKVIAQSGHYEPSVISLQNFIFLLHKAKCLIHENTTIYFADRVLTENHNDNINFEQNDLQLNFSEIISENEIKLPASPRYRFVTPKKLELLSKLSDKAKIIIKIVIDSSVLNPSLDRTSDLLPLGQKNNYMPSCAYAINEITTTMRLNDFSKITPGARECFYGQGVNDWKLHVENDDDNGFYSSLINQMISMNHTYLSTISTDILPQAGLRLTIESDAVVSDSDPLRRLFLFVKTFNAILAIIDIRNLHLGFRCYFIDLQDHLQSVEFPDKLPDDKTIFRLAFTGKTYTSVRRHPPLASGAVRSGFCDPLEKVAYTFAKHTFWSRQMSALHSQYLAECEKNNIR